LFLTPNFVPRPLLTRPMEIAASVNPVTYIMEAARSLVLDGFDAMVLLKGFVVIGVAGALMIGASIHVINHYD
jgi:ABC-2 type transport system permease protein